MRLHFKWKLLEWGRTFSGFSLGVRKFWLVRRTPFLGGDDEWPTS